MSALNVYLSLEKQILKDIAAGNLQAPNCAGGQSRESRRSMVSPNAMPAGSFGQPRGTQRYTTIVRTDEDALTRAIIAAASQYGRYGYRRINSLLIEASWRVGWLAAIACSGSCVSLYPIGQKYPSGHRENTCFLETGPR
jgi:hypothetical protein